MGVLNVTPDSFSDGGLFFQAEHAYDKAMSMVSEGADWIDIGGESSRPGALSISLDEELSRVIPVIERIRQVSDICLSIDTCKTEVMEASAHLGVNLINDITALQGEHALSTVARLGLSVCLMHMQGIPQTMQLKPEYHEDVVTLINDYFSQRLHCCLEAGIPREKIILDPGIGFGKSVRHNLSIIKRMNEFHQHQCPLMLGVSRKSMIGSVLNRPISERLFGSIAVAVFTAVQGGAAIIRTHDVCETHQALEMVGAIMNVV